MWGSLTLKAIPKPPTPEKQDKNASSSSSTGLTALTTPNQIELDISKSVHHVGRLPNPSKPFTHSTQHVIPVTFLSATHFSIGIGPNSNNGTNSQQWKAVNNHPNVYAGVEITDETSILSDHYPVFAAWRTVDPVTLF
jgi:hypothetical protein